MQILQKKYRNILWNLRRDKIVLLQEAHSRKGKFGGYLAEVNMKEEDICGISKEVIFDKRYKKNDVLNFELRKQVFEDGDGVFFVDIEKWNMIWCSLI